MKVLTILYPSKDNDEFSFDFYRKRHAPLIKEIMGDSLHHLEVRRGTPGPDGKPPLYIAVINIWIADYAAYEERVAKRQQEMIDELPLFTKQMPVVQVDEVEIEL